MALCTGGDRVPVRSVHWVSEDLSGRELREPSALSTLHAEALGGALRGEKRHGSGMTPGDLRQAEKWCHKGEGQVNKEVLQKPGNCQKESVVRRV